MFTSHGNHDDVHTRLETFLIKCNSNRMCGNRIVFLITLLAHYQHVKIFSRHPTFLIILIYSRLITVTQENNNEDHCYKTLVAQVNKRRQDFIFACQNISQITRVAFKNEWSRYYRNLKKLKQESWQKETLHYQTGFYRKFGIRKTHRTFLNWIYKTTNIHNRSIYFYVVYENQRPHYLLQEGIV